MLKQFIRNSLTYSVAGVLARGVSFLLLPFYTRVLLPKDYGTVDILTVFGNFVTVTIALEISQALTRNIVDAKDDDERQTYASTAFWFSVGIYSIFVVISLFLCPIIARYLLGDVELWHIVPYSLLAIWSSGIVYMLLLLLAYQLRTFANAVCSLTITVVSLLATIVMVLFCHMGVKGVFAGQAIGNIVSGMLAYILARDTVRLKFDRRKLVQMLRFSVPLVPASVSVVASLYINRFAVLRLMSLSSVGILGVAYRLVSVVPILMAGIQTALAPLIYTNYRKPETPSEIARILRFFLFVSILAFLALSLFSDEILRIMATPAYAAAQSAIPALALSAILSKMYDFAPGLFIAKRTMIIAIINIGAAVLVVLLNFLFIPLWGISGAAWATCVSSAATMGAYVVAGQFLYRIPYDTKPILLSAALAIAIVIVTGHLYYPLVVELAVKSCLLIVSAIMFVRFGLISMDEVRRGVSKFRFWIFRISGLRSLVDIS